MAHKWHKYRLLLDENFSSRKNFPRLNHRHDLKHIRDDLHKGGINEEVYKIAIKSKRVIVTFNDRHFFSNSTKNPDTGIIGVSTNLTDDQIDAKLNSFLSKHPPKKIYGHFSYISR